jgi:hypothetical protein
MYGGEERYIQNFGGETRGKKVIGRLKGRWEDNIKIDFGDVECWHRLHPSAAV